MRVAAIYDIHGNAPALEAVLAAIDELGVDRIVVGGDVLPGPMPSECLSLLRSLKTPIACLRGNGENDVLSVVRGEMPSRVPAPVREILRWTAGTLSGDEVEFIETWSDTVRLECEPGRVLFCHATPSSDNDIFTSRTPDAVLLPIFEPAGEPIVVCGHTHMPFERVVGGTRVVNAGSVGMPFGPPGADWLLIDGDIDPRRTDFDLEAAAARIRDTDYPAAAEFAERYVLSPPSREAMLDMMERGSIRWSESGTDASGTRDFERSIEIDAPPGVVWDVMREGARWPEWTPGVTSIVPLDDGPLAVGHRYRIKQPKFPPAVWKVTAIEEGRGFTWVSGVPGMRVSARHVVSPIERGARATLSLRFEGPLGGLMGRLTRDINRRYLELEANGLKRESEARAAG